MKLKYFIKSTLLILLFSSCKEDIIIMGDQKETAVIYGVLDPSESIQYIKITRAINGTANAIKEAKNESVNYFDNVEATVFEVIDGKKTNISWKLEDTIISGRAEGLYYGPTQKVYFFRTDTKKPLRAEPNVFYHLEVKLNNKYTITSITDIVREVDIKPFGPYEFATMNNGKNDYVQTNLDVSSGSSTVVNVQLDIHVQQKFADNTTRIDTLIWKITESSFPIGKTKLNIPINGEDFYNIIAAGFKNQTNVNQRKLIGIDLTATFGSNTLEKYIAMNKPSSSLAQTKTNFTNLTSKDDIRLHGIFTSRNKQIKHRSFNLSPLERVIDYSSSKELCSGKFTNGLNFCTEDNHFTLKNFYCKN